MNTDNELTSEDYQRISRVLELLIACPPTIQKIVESGDDAINAAGLNPYCMNEGLASGNETHLPWWVSDLKAKVDLQTASVPTP